MRLSLAAFAAVGGGEVGPPSPEVLAELAAAGAVVRRSDGALVVDPALQAAVRTWADAPVGVAAVRTAGEVSVHVEGALDPALGVVVVRGRRGRRDLDAVDVVAPGPAGVLDEVARQACAPPVGADDAVWARVRGGRTAWTGRYEAADADGLRRDLTHALVAALTHEERGAWR